MDWQEPVAFLIVALAVYYLWWKMRGGRRRRGNKGPDVKVSDLRRKSRRD